MATIAKGGASGGKEQFLANLPGPPYQESDAGGPSRAAIDPASSGTEMPQPVQRPWPSWKDVPGFVVNPEN